MNQKHPSFLVYGPSGSGISTALQAFRDHGFLAIAGIQPESAERFLLMAEEEGKPIALAPEINPDETSADTVKAALEALKARFPELKMLYLSTPTPVLIQRYAEKDKPHPYETNGLKNAIEHEQGLYKQLKPLSDYHVDTSTTSALELALKVAKVLGIQTEAQPMTINLLSFGFKNGAPNDAEMIFDMRFLPNPFYDESLRPFSGLDKPVKDYIFSFPETAEFLEYWQKLLVHSLPLYQRQGKTRITIGIGCTGGQHRSVCLTMALANYLKEALPDCHVRITHREQQNWPQPTPTPQR